MDDAAEVESYSSAAAARHLDAIDDTFVEHLLRLLPPSAASAPGCGLDVGTGPAEIPIKLLKRVPSLRMIGVDRSRNMLVRARQNAEAAGVSNRLELLRADAHSLPFRDGVFSVVLCNSVLHHARDPVTLVREMSRVAAPGAALLLRDLRRPTRLLMRWHLWRHGRHYRGTMRSLFNASVRAAYTPDELNKIVVAARVERLATFRFGGTHIGCERIGH
ncbi:MAG: class I SAM-dependent methyltransferase [Acidobacteria bacterium]|nr:class I SAM-dependent methyltransferase [Acidobacteriota bacterium]